MNLLEVVVAPVKVDEEGRFQGLIQADHYLGGAAEDRLDPVVRGGGRRRVSDPAELLGGGFSLEASVRIEADDDRAGLERLLRFSRCRDMRAAGSLGKCPCRPEILTCGGAHVSRRLLPPV